MPKVTDPSPPASGVSQAPPEPRPTVRTPVSAPVSVLNRHSRRPVEALQASRRLDTFADDTEEPAASRVLARSPFGYGHDPDGAAAPGNLLVAGAG